jgi:hypothetical protein
MSAQSQAEKKDTHEVQDAPHFFHSVLDQGTGEPKTRRTLHLLDGQGTGGSRLLEAMRFIRYHNAGDQLGRSIDLREGKVFDVLNIGL